MVCVVLLMNGLNLISQIDDSTLADAKFSVPEEPVLGPLLFLIYINNSNQALKFCKVHHFADDTNLIHFGKSVNRLNKNLTYWLNANKISLNVKKTELVIFKHQRKKLDSSNSAVKGSTLLSRLSFLASKLMRT